MVAGDSETASAFVTAAIDTARERDDGMALARAARMAMLALGEFERGEAILAEALTYADVRAQPGRESRVLTIRAVARFARGYPLEAIEEMRRAVAISRQDADTVRWTGQIGLANALITTGRIEEGIAAMKETMGDLPSAAPMHAIIDGYRAFELGDVDGGLALLTSGSDAMLTEFDFDPLGRAVTGAHVLDVRAMCEVHGGRPDAALQTIRRLDALSPEPFSDVAADSAYVLARAGAATGDREAQRQARRRIADLARVASGPAVIATVEAVHGFTGTEASRHLQAAAALFERAPRYVLAAELWCDAGTGPALERARSLCEVHGLRRLGARVAALRPLPAVLDQLTTREREVVALAADGAHEPRDRRTPLPLGGHRPELPVDGLRQARRVAPVRARPARARLKGAAQELAGGVARHAFDHDDLTRPLPRREPIRQPGLQFSRLRGVREARRTRPAPDRIPCRDDRRQRHRPPRDARSSSRSTSAGATL